MESLYIEFKGRDYLEQWERVQRWYRKLLLVKHGYYKELSDRELLDIVYAFFLNVHHLKDWVGKHNNEQYKARVEILLKERCFVLAAELANGHKHFIKNHHSSDVQSSIKSQNVKVTVGTAFISLDPAGDIESEVLEQCQQRTLPGAQYSWDFIYQSEKFDCFNIGKQCYKNWFDFLQTNNLF